MLIGPQDDGYSADAYAPVKDRREAFPPGVHLLSQESYETLMRAKLRGLALTLRHIKRDPE